MGGETATKINLSPELLLPIYNVLLNAIGPRHWWPGETPLEIIVGAILTQNTAWKNVEKAIANLKKRGVSRSRLWTNCRKMNLPS